MAGTTLGPIIVWVDYGREGWVPESFADPDKAIAFATGGAHGKAVITERIDIVPGRKASDGEE
jgi:hypothetical protein